MACSSPGVLAPGEAEWPSYLSASRIQPSVEQSWTHQPGLALVMPYFPSQLSRVRNAVAKWMETPACAGSGGIADAVFVQTVADYAFKNPSELQLQQSQVLNLTSNCFRSILFYTLAIPAKWDNRVDGSSYVFYALLNLLSKRYGHMLLFEPDVIPLKPGWLDVAASHAASNACCASFWQTGSAPMCEYDFYGANNARTDFHINGNSLYCLGDPAFGEYRTRVQSYYTLGFPGSSTGKTAEEGFDHAMFQFRMQPENYGYSATVMHKFLYANWLVNYCESKLPLPPAPLVMLGHTKNEFFDQETRYVLQSFPGLFGRYPSSKELAFLLPLVKRELDKKILLFPSHLAEIACGSVRGRMVFGRACSWPARYPNKIYLWNSDFHGAPIGCNMGLFFDIGVVTHAEVDGPHCKHFNVCRRRLKVLRYDDWRGVSLDPNPARLTRKFVAAYKNDPEMARVDVVMCSHPVANCELYLGLNKPLVLYATTRLEFGRLDRFVDWRKPYITAASAYRWAAWVKTVQTLAAQPWNAVLANNWYDAHYIKYHTGVMPTVLPSWCGTHAHPLPYKAQRGGEVLIVPYRENLDFPEFRSAETWAHPVLAGLRQASGFADTLTRFSFTRMRDAYSSYTLEQVAAHPALLYIPYQSSVMSFFEFYRLEVPIFAPSHALLCDWQRKHGVGWERVYGDPPRLDRSWDFPYNPNSNRSEDACAWLAYSDQYHTPHVLLFNSWPHFLQLLHATNLSAVSASMADYNARLYANLTHGWNMVLQRVVKEHKKHVIKTAELTVLSWELFFLCCLIVLVMVSHNNYNKRRKL
jgi:hypothetical protein